MKSTKTVAQFYNYLYLCDMKRTPLTQSAKNEHFLFINIVLFI